MSFARNLMTSVATTAVGVGTALLLDYIGLPAWAALGLCALGMLVSAGVLLDLWLIDKRLNRGLDKQWRTRWYARWIR